MNDRLLKRLLTILAIWTTLLACTNSETKSDQNSNQENTETKGQTNPDKDPEVILAIIQDRTNPPSERLVDNFGELLISLKGYYSDIATSEMADKLALAYDLAAEKGNKETLLEFVEGFRNGVQNSINSNVRYDFTEYLANYTCYKTNCNSGDTEMFKFFDSDYKIPSRKSQYEGGDFVLIKNIETFKQRFNSFSKEAKSSLRIQQVKIHGEQNDPGKAFEYSFSTNFSVIGGLNKKDNSINSLGVIIENSQSLSEVANFMVVIIGIIASTNPSLTPTDRGEILKEVGLIDIQNIDVTEPWTGKAIRNGVVYNFSIIPGQAVLFNAGQPEN